MSHSGSSRLSPSPNTPGSQTDQGADPTLHLGSRAEGRAILTLLQLYKNRIGSVCMCTCGCVFKCTLWGGAWQRSVTDSRTHPLPLVLRRENGRTPRMLGSGEERNTYEPLPGSVHFLSRVPSFLIPPPPPPKALRDGEWNPFSCPTKTSCPDPETSSI